ncbi:TPA: RHS repeat-associated core domain-containing protein [Pseudomonas putida]|nr:RHS repeat-associated core domain-containing protein [Pseudomonas putida]
MSTLKTTIGCYHYDALDQLTGVDRIGQEKLQRFYQREHLVTEIQGASSQSVFQHGTHLLALHAREGNVINSQLLCTDQQRSVLRVTDAAGTVQQAYVPYGHRRVDGGLGSLLGYTGERVDPLTGHYLLGNGHRGFNPVLMRLNSSDSLSPFGRGGLNPYAYCLGDPVNFSDPTGRFAEIGRLISSLLGLTNTGLGMTRPIPSFNLAKDALRLGAVRKLPPRQGFLAASTVVASGLILAIGAMGVGSAVTAITGDTEAAAILGFVALGLTALAFGSRVGAYWAARDPKAEAALKSLVENKGQVIPLGSSAVAPSAPSLELFSRKRTYHQMIDPLSDRKILTTKRSQAIRQQTSPIPNKKIRQF